jgi:hypothetical protein
MRQSLSSMVQPIAVHLNLSPHPHSASSVNEDASVFSVTTDKMAMEQNNTNPVSSGLSSGSDAGNWMNGNFNYAEMSRIGDKTPDIDEAFLQYSNYFP